jgi:hypothetical protein
MPGPIQKRNIGNCKDGLQPMEKVTFVNKLLMLVIGMKERCLVIEMQHYLLIRTY